MIAQDTDELQDQAFMITESVIKRTSTRVVVKFLGGIGQLRCKGAIFLSNKNLAQFIQTVFYSKIKLK